MCLLWFGWSFITWLVVRRHGRSNDRIPVDDKNAPYESENKAYCGETIRLVIFFSVWWHYINEQQRLCAHHCLNRAAQQSLISDRPPANGELATSNRRTQTRTEVAEGCRVLWEVMKWRRDEVAGQWNRNNSANPLYTTHDELDRSARRATTTRAHKAHWLIKYTRARAPAAVELRSHVIIHKPYTHQYTLNA